MTNATNRRSRVGRQTHFMRIFDLENKVNFRQSCGAVDSHTCPRCMPLARLTIRKSCMGSYFYFYAYMWFCFYNFGAPLNLAALPSDCFGKFAFLILLIAPIRQRCHMVVDKFPCFAFFLCLLLHYLVYESFTFRVQQITDTMIVGRLLESISIRP